MSEDGDCDSDCGVSGSKRPCTDAELEQVKAYQNAPKFVCMILMHGAEDGMLDSDITINYAPFAPGLSALLKHSTPLSRRKLHGVIPGITERGEFDNTTWVSAGGCPTGSTTIRVPVTGNTVWKTVDNLETFTLENRCQCVFAFE